MLTVVLVLCFVGGAYSIAIDNAVSGINALYCFRDGMKVLMTTDKPFTGHVYVKGQFGNPQCNRNFTGETNRLVLGILYNDCIHKRTRMVIKEIH